MAIHKFFTAVLTHKVITIYGDGTQTRDFTFISDVVDALVLAAETERFGEVFNVGGGSQITVSELVEKIERIAGQKAKVDYVNKQKGDVKDTRADISKAWNMLGWRPRWHIEKGLEEYLRWYCEGQDVHR
jgi:UDP-glucose 4-epimerase